MWRRALAAAYLEPGRKHEAAAADLAMSYSTFRRHLGAATDRLAQILWDRETS